VGGQVKSGELIARDDVVRRLSGDRPGPAQRALEQRGAQAACAAGAQQRVEARVRRRAERVEDDD
jgi:hypothetical protein